VWRWLGGYGCRGGGGCDRLGCNGDGRIDASISTFFGVHSGLAMSSIYTVDRKSQKQKCFRRWPRMEKIGCLRLTERCGSGAGGGLLTDAKREGDTGLSTARKWIGNAPWCDISIIWARDLADNQVKGFIVENKTTPGFKVEKIRTRLHLR